MEKVGFVQFPKDLYTSYDQTNDYVEKKYNVVFPKEWEEKVKSDIKKAKIEKQLDKCGGTNVLPFDKLDKFIEDVSNIDLDEYIKENR